MKFKISILLVLLITNQLSSCMQEDTNQITGQKRRAEENFVVRAAKTIRTLANNYQNSSQAEISQDQVDFDTMQTEENFAASANKAEQKEPGSKYISTNNYLGYDEIRRLISQTICNDLLSRLQIMPSGLINILVDKASNFFSTTLTGHTDQVKEVLFSPDGTKIATCSTDKTAKIWDVKTDKLIHNLDHFNSVMQIAFSPDGTLFATRSYEPTAKIWDIETGQLIHELNVNGTVVEISFSPDSKKLATGSTDKTVKIWCVETGNLMHSLSNLADSVQSISFSPDGRRIATGEGYISFIKNPSNINSVKIWDADTGNLIHSLVENTGTINTIFSHDSLKLATSSWDKTAKIWDVGTGKLIHNLIGHESKITSLSFSHDDTKIVTSSMDNTAKIWDVETGNLIHNITGHTWHVRSVLFKPHAKEFATCSWDKTTKIWDSDTGNLILTLYGHTNSINSISFSQDGSKLATCSMDKTAKIWHFDRIDAINDALRSLNYEQVEILTIICDAFRKIKDTQYIKLSAEQKAIVDSLPASIKVPLKMALKTIFQKFCKEKTQSRCNIM